MVLASHLTSAPSGYSAVDLAGQGDRQVAAAMIARRAEAIAELAVEKARTGDEEINKSDDKNNDPFGLYSDKRNGFYGLVAKNAYETSSKLG